MPANEDDGLAGALAQAAFMTMAVLSKAGADHDLSLTQLRVLGILRDRRLRMTALADFLGLEKSTMSGLIDRAEKRGLVQRAPSAGDRRVVEVFLTPAGHELAARFTGHVQAALRPMTSQLTAAEQHRLQALLERMTAGREP
ncbi:MAG TPA: MarR family transcriptional regulator [Trebonia sp.]|jgi:DNA-binding MarR family transcriptional regulator|nr:MarR family transcriptional regulator [Trebonia sp.]